MKTSHLARYVGLVAALVLAGCGGGDYSGGDEAAEVTICRAALARAGDAPSLIDPMTVSRSLYATDYGKLVDFSNAEPIGSPHYVSYGSCRLAGATVLRITLANGTVVPGP